MFLLERLRAEARSRGLSDAEVERGMALVRPCGVHREDGVVVGRFGGPIMVPADAGERLFPLVATINCAAVPSESLDIALPSDGQLLFFGYPEEDGLGEVLYVPEGVAVEERQLDESILSEPYFDEVHEDYQRGDLKIVPRLSLPFFGETEALAEICAADWDDSGRTFLLGGYGTDCNGELPTDYAANAALDDNETQQGRAADADDWVLLAEITVDHPASGGADMFWAIRREDLASQRFERAGFVTYFNP
ncbi:DUF1963 domain-containing protein [Lentzea sp. NPDC058436]|uniref:DUF1963 domain-containing protein n=1 Tax=Lentzea sp. NPDC058436 TaxID=3346499 RepID=UPI00365E170E